MSESSALEVLMARLSIKRQGGKRAGYGRAIPLVAVLGPIVMVLGPRPSLPGGRADANQAEIGCRPDRAHRGRMGSQLAR
jgi:hypothetical protein